MLDNIIQKYLSLDDLWDNNPLAYILINRSLKIIDSNEAARNLLEYPQAEFEEKPIEELFTRDDKTIDLISELFSKEDGPKVQVFEVQWKTAKGFVLFVRLNISLTSSGNNAVISVCDLTECKKREDKIQVLESLLDTIRSIQSASSKHKSRKKMLEQFCTYLITRRKYRAAWIAVFNSQHQVVEFSEAGLGAYPMEEIVRESNYPNCIRQIMGGTRILVSTNTIVDCPGCSLATIFGNTTCISVKLEFAGRILGMLNVHLMQDMGTDEEQDLLLSISKDLSLMVHSFEMEETRLEAQLELERAKKMKSDFIALASHQLRTPLTTIQEGINILLEEIAGSLSDEQMTFITALKRNTDRIKKVISSMLTLQKIETGMIIFNFKSLTVEELFIELEPLVSLRTMLDNTDIEYKVDDYEMPIYGDKEYLVTALKTILSRVFQNSEKPVISIGAVHDNGGVNIIFETDSCTLNWQDQVSYFQEPMLTYRLTHKSDELMIDMAICHQIIKHHRGRVTVLKRDDDGLTVRVSLPDKSD
jgi:PAS domain S-box-containing protein